MRALLCLLTLASARAEVKELLRSFSVSEDAPPNTLLGFLTDPPPPKGTDNYLIVFPPETEVEETLLVDASTGEIRTRSGLDYERKRDLVFLAIPIDGSSGIRVNIAVVDSNDHSPVFPVQSLELQLSEYAKIGSETPLPSATDADSALLSVQHYRIVSGNVNNAFRLSTKRLSGTLYLDLIVNAELDREFRSSYQLSIEALDGGHPPRTAALAVNIAIVDANDNPPQFAQPRYLAQLLENATVGQQVIQVSATDADEGANAQIEYRLAPSPANAHSFFSISPDTGLVRLRRPLPTQARPQQLELLVVARDKGLQPLESTAFVTISVLSPSQYLPQISVVYLSPDGRPAVSEAAKIGDFIARLSVRDPETSEDYTRPVKLNFGTPNRYFSLNKTKEAVYILSLAQTLDRELRAEHSLDLVATDSSGRVGRKNLSIAVADINDSEPRFTQASYEAEVEERAGVGASVLQVTAVDPDQGPNGTVRYSLESPHEGWFAIDPSTGLITTQAGIDCEVSSQPQLTVTARDLGFPTLSSTASIRLRILDVNDNAPVFSKSIYNVSLGEDTEVGSCFLKVSAKDPDCGVNAAVRYALEESGLAEFSLDEMSGTLCLEAPLDFESRTSFQFQVFATDGGGLSSSSLIRVRVEDRDDNAPVFYPSHYNVSLRHDAAPGLPLLLVSATDADSGAFAAVEYSLTPSEDAALFRIDSARGELYIDKPLQSRSYRLSVEAVDGGGLAALSPAIIHVNVLQPHQFTAPVFARKLYQFSIREDTLPGIALGSVEATGPGPVRYAIYSGDPGDNFAIDPDSGSITVQKYLDADEQESLLLNIQASSGNPPVFNHTQVRVEIRDVNDNGPVWERVVVRTSVGEDQSTESPFYVVEAQDRDRGRNGDLTYRILESNPPGPFLVRPLSGELFVVSPLDYEEHQSYTLTLSATDAGLPSKSAQLTLHIEVTDANDHAPVFGQQVFDAVVSEDAAILHRIAQITATDADSAHNGAISYSLAPPNDVDGQFGVMADSGWVYVRKPLDRESSQTHNINIVARDNGSPSLSNTARLRIGVLDTNDNSPTCEEGKAAGVVEENSPSRTFVGKLDAKDADFGRNATLTFELLNQKHLFFLEPTGELYTRGPLDAEVRTEYELSVRVADQGVQSRSTLCPFRISVADTNDNSPFFVLPYQSKVSIREEVPLGTELVQVRATDPDSGRNGTVEYSLGQSEGASFFRIHPETGVITLTARLDFETLQDPLFHLEIIARDGGSPSKKSVKKLDVEVTDIADSEGSNVADYSIRFQVTETSPVGTRIGALDPERAKRFRDPSAVVDAENLDVFFEIIGGNSQEIFDIDRVSSILYLVKPLDYETSPLHVLKISRVDQSRAGLPVITEGRVEVTVTDENDNSPVWAQDPIITSLPEDAPVGHLVWKFAASDSDAGANGRLVYSIVEQSPRNAFSIDSVTGELWVDSPLDYETQSEYLVIIQASDQAQDAAKRRTSRVTARIYLTDLNDNAPKFVSRERVDVFEDEPAGYPLIHALATDPDWQDNGRVTYSILEGDEEQRFALNSTSGALQLAKRLSRHSQKRKFQLRILAEDHGKPPLSATQLLDVYVQDVNTQGPRFTHSVFKATVQENSSPGTNVLVVKADNPAQSALGSKDLVYYLPAGLTPDNFKIDERSGQISTTSILDREVQSRYILTVYVRMGSGGSDYDAATVLVEVGDENDGRPVLGSGACNAVSLPENTPFTAFHTVRASDPDVGPNAQLVYSITGGNVDGKFEMSPSTGEISCKRLDRETVSSYSLKLVVQDSGSPSLSDTCTMAIMVVDLNDEAPRFSESEYSAEVSEDFAVGGTVLSVSALDPDAAGPNSRITYSLRDHADNLFLIHPQTGAIQTIAPLDAETRSLYSFSVVARDEGVREPKEAASRVTISVTDLNDHSPVFAELPFVANISTNTPSGQRVLRISATDADGPGDFSRITYRFLQNHDDFSINPTTGVIAARRDLFFKQGSLYYLEVEAADGGGRASLGMVEVRVGGEVSPELLRFPQAVYHATVPEDTKTNTLVHTCEAHRRNGVPDGPKSYRIVAGDPQGIFTMDDTGRVRVGKPLLLDRESEPVYRLVVECSAGSEHAFTALVVEVEDANDHQPQFLQQRYASAVWEGKPPGTFVMQVSAVDRDSGENAHITYSIVSGNQDSAFVVDEVGRVSTGLELDREIKDRYQLSLMATDAGQPPKSSTTLLEIQVVDVNDNKPSFPPPKSITMSEATALGTQLALISANDVDQEPVLVYSFRQGGNPGALFAIDPFTGRLSLAAPLDYETGPRHMLQVQVSDEIHVATTKVEVVVTDENDNAPEFSQSFYQVSLPEDTPPGSSILQMDATDADSADAGKLKYSLSGAVPTGESSPGFWINPNTGALHSNLSLSTGRYRGSLVELGVRVEDDGSPPRSAFASVQIQILSRAVQGQPRFAQPEYRFSVSEDTPPHTPIGSVAVANPDSFDGILYHILSGNEERKFRVDPSGQIVLSRHLDREERDEYALELSVHIKTNSVANSTARVVISVMDVNDCGPVFREKEAHAKIGESAAIGSTLITLTATDADTGSNGAVLYEITSGNEKGFFTMDMGTGLVSVAKRLEEGQFRLIIKAKDGGDPPRSAIATVLVSIQDENNNGPFFPIPLLLARINENAPPGTLVFTAKATDRDGSDYGKLTYELRDSNGPGHGTAKGLYKINPVSGEIRTMVPFDYETRNTYYFLVEAIDKGGRTATVPGQVLIRGLDEFAPAFNQPGYSFSVPYDAAIDFNVGVIYATDADSGLDGIISYSFQEPSEYFAINSATGVISVTKDLMPLSKESPLGVKQDKSKTKRAVTIDSASIGGDNDPYKDAEMEPLVRIMFLDVVAESGSGGGKRNTTRVEFKLGHFSQTTLRNSVLDSRTITIISVVLILLLILILLFVACKLRRKTDKAPSPLPNKAPRVHSTKRSGARTPVGPRLEPQRRHHSGPRGDHGPYSRPPTVKVSAFANAETLYGVGNVRSKDETDYQQYQRPDINSTFQPRAAAPAKTSGSNISNRSSGRGSAFVEDDSFNTSSPHVSRMNRSEHVRSIPDSGIHVFQDDNASMASDLPSAQDYLTSLGITAPLSDHPSMQTRVEYAESQTDDGVDVQELIYSKVSEVLGEDGSMRLLGESEQATMRTFYPAKGTVSKEERGRARGPPAPVQPGPSYQPLTHVFSEISKLKSEQETLRRRPPPPPTRLTFAPPQGQSGESPSQAWGPQYASPDEPPPPPPAFPPRPPFDPRPAPLGVPRRVSRNSASESEREIKI